MVISRDVTSLSCWGSRIFLQRSHSICITHVFYTLEHGRDSMQFHSPPGFLVLWAPPSLLLKKRPLCHGSNTIVIYSVELIPRKEDCTTKLVVLRAVTSCAASSCSDLNQGKALLIMASEGSTSSGPSVDVRIGSLESSMGRLRARLDNQDKMLQDVNKAGEQTWDLLNKDLRKLREDLSASTEKLEDFKDEMRTSFKDAAITHGDFGKRISALEFAVSKLMAKLGI